MKELGKKIDNKTYTQVEYRSIVLTQIQHVVYDAVWFEVRNRARDQVWWNTHTLVCGRVEEALNETTS